MKNVTILLAVVAVMAIGVPTSVGTDYFAPPSTTPASWHVGGNWLDGSVPGAQEHAVIDGNYTAQITAGVSMFDFYTGGSKTRGSYIAGPGHVDMTAGSLSTRISCIGTYAGATSIFTQSGGAFSSNEYLCVGWDVATGLGDGKYTISGGSLSVSGSLHLGHSNGGVGEFEVDGAGATSIALGGGYKMYAGKSTLTLVFGGGADPIQQIDVTGTAELTGTLDVTGTANAGTYTIIDYGTLSGTFGTVNLPSSDWSINYNDGGKVTLTVIPEPATMVLLGLGGLGVLLRRRRK